MSKQLTGRHVFYIAAGAFSVVIAANMAMLYASVSTFPGLVVENSYVASQSFDARVAAQKALGWSSAAAFSDGAVRLQLTDRAGQPVEAARLNAQIGRPTLAPGTLDLIFDPVSRAYVADPDLAPGLWQLDVLATAADGTLYETHIDLTVPRATP